MAWTKIPKEHHPIFFDAVPDDPRVETIKMFGGEPSSATRLAARDAEGDPERRDAIVNRVVDDAASNAAAAGSQAVTNE